MPSQQASSSEPLLDTDAQRLFAVAVVRSLCEAGYEALWAGGCVRDSLLGVTPKDYDIATNATPEEIRNVFGRRRTLAIGAAFGVITVLGPRNAGQIEVATFRQDAGYSDGRRPDGVRFTDVEHDARRRDFTINGLFYDPMADRVLDYVGGEKDLAAHRVRAIGNPDHRFDEDKLRMLRAVRFAATLRFEIDKETEDAIRQHAEEIKVVSAERIGAELRRMLLNDNRAYALQKLADVRLIPHVLPELAHLDPDDFLECHAAVERLQAPGLSLVLATLLSFNPSARAETTVRRLRYPNEVSKRVGWLLANLAKVVLAEKQPWPRLQRILSHEGAEEIVALHEAIQGREDAASRFCRAKLRLPPEELNPPPLVSGDDLVASGFRPGLGFGALLDLARDNQLEGRLTNKAQAIEFLRNEDRRQSAERES